MYKIVQKAIKQFEYQQDFSERKLLQFCRASPLYDKDMNEKKMMDSIKKGIKNSKKDVLRRLDYHFNRETNKLLFDIYEIILRNPKGLKYKDIKAAIKDESNKTDIIAISHYCRKLYKANFITVTYIREGTFVTAIRYSSQKEQNKQETQRLDKNDANQEYPIEENEDKKDQPQKLKLSEGFLIKELSIDNNIMLNMTGMESLLKDGLTKQEISGNIFKVSQKKTISRLIQNSKHQRDGQRKGRIYGFRFKGDLQKIKKYTEKHSKVPSKTSIVSLDSEVQQYLQKKHPNIESQNLLQHLIDNHKTQASTRQCDPIKLSRFIYVLNFLNNSPSTVQNMLSHIIDQDKINNKVNIGTMHKKSLTAILNSLVSLNLITLEVEEGQSEIYPVWKKLDKLPKQQIFIPKLYKQPKQPRQPKQPKQLRSVSKRKKLQQCKIMPEKEGFKCIASSHLLENIKSSIISILRFAFKKIKTVGSPLQHEPQIDRPHVLHILDMPSDKVPSLKKPSTIEELFEQIDNNLKPFLRVQENIKFLDFQSRKFLRTYPNKKVSDYTKRFSKGDIIKIEELVDRGILQTNGEHPNETYRFKNELESYMI